MKAVCIRERSSYREFNTHGDEWGGLKSAYFHYYGSIREGWTTESRGKSSLDSRYYGKKKSYFCKGASELEL